MLKLNNELIEFFGKVNLAYEQTRVFGSKAKKPADFPAPIREVLEDRAADLFLGAIGRAFEWNNPPEPEDYVQAFELAEASRQGSVVNILEKIKVLTHPQKGDIDK